MTFAPWRSILARALHRNRSRPYCRYMQLATINKRGKPANRTVVFRGFVQDCLQIITDGRSEKIDEILACPWAEVCWYFTVTREQFRISGQLTVVGADNQTNIRLQAWQGLSPKARQQFYWPHPGHPRAESSNFETEAMVLEQPPDSFYVLLLGVQRVDHLNLKGEPQNRCIYEYTDQGWTMGAVNP
ncbi:MAG: Npun_F5749 family FMN-dependent PPOX-type flavoprotein [Cyanobacteria bacterium P01_D01_bin.156]